MKLLIILALATVAIAARLPPQEDEDQARQGKAKKPEEVTVLVDERHQHLDGTYEIDIELSDGQKLIENAVLKTVKDEEGNDKVILSISGISEYKNADGSIDHREYKADENGSDIRGNSVPHEANENEEEDAPAAKSIPPKPAQKGKTGSKGKPAPKPKAQPAPPKPAEEEEEEAESGEEDDGEE